MLHPFLMRRLAQGLMMVLFAATSVTAGAQPGAVPNVPSTVSPAQASGAQPITEERIRAAQDSARDIVANTLERANEALEQYREFGEQQRRRADDIADKTLAESRKEVLDFLGIDAEGQTSLYYFVSYNMPLSMLRAYALEAMWAGGTLVLRGVPPGKTLAQFVTEDLRELVHDKGAAAAISVDPRLFDAYQVKLVPSIVLTTERSNFECTGRNPTPFTYKRQRLSYDRCPPIPCLLYTSRCV